MRSSEQPPAPPTLTPDARLSFDRIGLPRRGFADLYHRLIASTWPALLALLAGGYLAVNGVFALLYLAVGGVLNARPGSFEDAFFFSVQTIATIGYGSMVPQSLAAHLVVTVEVFVGLFGLATITGIVFSKFARPTARVRFSRQAIVTPRDGVMSLVFRMANERGSTLVEATAHVGLLCDEITLEGESVRRFHDLALVRNTNLLFALSWTVIHPIDERSPFHQATRQSLEDQDAAVIVSVLGIDEATGQTVHARHAYLAGDIVWNARFVDIIRISDSRRHSIDYRHFDEVTTTG